MNVTQPFFPDYGSGNTHAPNAGAVDMSASIKQGCKQVAFTNLTANVCFVRMWPPGVKTGDAGAVAATANDMPIAPNTAANAQVLLSKDNDCVGGSVFCAGVGSINAISGNGI